MWIKSFIFDRTEQVTIAERLSKPNRIKKRYSPFGLSLFLIYINNLPSAICVDKLIHFPNDTTLTFKGNSVEILEQN